MGIYIAKPDGASYTFKVSDKGMIEASASTQTGTASVGHALYVPVGINIEPTLFNFENVETG